MSRAATIARARTYFDSGEFLVDLGRRVAIPSTNQEPERAPALRRYLDEEMLPSSRSRSDLPRVFSTTRRAPLSWWRSAWRRAPR